MNSLGTNMLPTPEEMASKVINLDIYNNNKKIEESKNSFFAKCFTKEDSYWEDQKKLYIEIENWVRDNPDKIPSWQVAGPLNYSMSPNQMKDVITNKFKEMANSGHLLTEDTLCKERRESLYPTNRRGSANLTRIWGAEFLKSNLEKENNLDAADHFLILDNSETDIEVEVWYDKYPYLSVAKNAHILSKKIDGVAQARSYMLSSQLQKLGYRDFTDPGNILRDENGIGWVVDTEQKSFHPQELDRDLGLVNDYLRKRFKVLAGEDHLHFHTFKIPVADLLKV